MSDILAELISEINWVLSAMRVSFDFSRSNPPWIDAESEEVRKAYFRFEEVRFDFLSDQDSSRKRSFTKVVGIVNLRRGLDLLSDDRTFRRIATQVTMARIPKRPKSDGHRLLHPKLYGGKILLADAIEFLIDSLHDLPTQSVLPLDDEFDQIMPFDARNIRKVVPREQVLAPLKFDIIDYRISISPQSPQLLEEDRQSASSAKETLLANGTNIIGELEKSNCDPRLLDNVKDLQQKLEAEADIIKLGLANIGTGIMCGAFANELPEAVFSMIEAHNVGISMYVGQFIEWRTFSEKAALAEISSDDTAIISDAAEKLIGELERNPHLADPEVPRSLRALNSLLDNPRDASKRAAFAVLRSIENLFIKVFNYGTDLLEKTAEKAVEKGSTAAARAIVYSMMTAALVAAAELSPIASHIPNSGWVSKAVEVVQKQLDKLD